MNAFESLLGPEPNWQKCKCGAMSSRVPCWDCSQAEAERADGQNQRALALASIPARYAWANANSPDLPVRVTSVQPLEVIIQKTLSAGNVIFHGPSGSGKTSLAVACLRERVPHGLFVSAIKLGFARIQSAAGQGEAGIVEKAINAKLLMIDEVGGEQKTATNAVKDIIFARHDSDRPTWITTGFSSAQLGEMYGDGFLRRVLEGAYVVRLGQ